MNKGVKCPDEVRKRISESKKGIPNLKNIGEKNRMWKGDNVKYRALHHWIKRNLPKSALCNACGLKPPYDIANISGEYLRNITDWHWLCRACHMRSDGRINNLVQYRVISNVRSH